eukprot:COSAG05_NODE_1878_length_3911_cov_62.469576_5_plen_162_part_00
MWVQKRIRERERESERAREPESNRGGEKQTDRQTDRQKQRANQKMRVGQIWRPRVNTAQNTQPRDCAGLKSQTASTLARKQVRTDADAARAAGVAQPIPAAHRQPRARDAGHDPALVAGHPFAGRGAALEKSTGGAGHCRLRAGSNRNRQHEVLRITNRRD